jgi:hypothetical protein
VFGPHHVVAATDLVIGELERWGYRPRGLRLKLLVALAHVMLANRSPLLAEPTTGALQAIHDTHLPAYLRNVVVTASRALTSLGLFERALESAELV